MDKKRRFSRVTAQFDVILRADDGDLVTGTLRDIAVQGAFVRCEPTLPIDSRVAVTIVLHGGIDDLQITARAQVVRREDDGLGLYFTEVDLESVEHLRNIITFNAEAPDVVWEEMRGGHTLRDA